jgi:hypothetical protein
VVNSEKDEALNKSAYNYQRNATQKNTVKSTTKSITFYTKPMPGIEDTFKRRNRLQSNYKRVKAVKKKPNRAQ